MLNSKRSKKRKEDRTEDWLFLGLGLMHECVERVVEGVHEVGVVDWRLGPWVNNDSVLSVFYKP